jgi:hypothetical protein
MLINEESENEIDEEESDSEMEIDAPKVEENETFDSYFKRTLEFWFKEASKEFPEEKSKKVLNKMAKELCILFWDHN